MELGHRLLFDIFVMFVSARIGGWLLARLGQPPILGELLAGIVIGPRALGLVGRPPAELVALLGEEAASAALQAAYSSIAELGLIFLLFFVGLETRVQEIFKVGRRAAAVATLGVLFPFLLGYGSLRLMGRAEVEALFVGAALVATSTGITARTLRDLGVIRSTEARIILGAAVIDDILSLLVLAVVAGLGGARRSSPFDVVFLLLEALGFVAFVALVGSGIVRRYGPRLRTTEEPNVPFVLAVGICLGLAVLASQIGLSPIVGAFLAGMVLAEARGHLDIERAALPVYELLAPFFFVVVGTQVDLGVFGERRTLELALLLSLLAVLGKLIGCGIGAWGLGWRRTVIVSVGMVPRGEIGLVVVTLGRALNAVPEEIFSVMVAISLLTTVGVPPVLKRLFVGVRLLQPAAATAGDMRQEGRLPNLGVVRALGATARR